ncbi:unnamed protein product [Ixodes pacificus]
MYLTGSTKHPIKCLSNLLRLESGPRAALHRVGISTAPASFSYSPACKRCVILKRTIPQFTSTLRCLSKKTTNTGGVTASTMILQDGVSIEELPVLIKKLTAESLLSREYASKPDAPPTETHATIEASGKLFKDCTSIKDVYATLHKCDSKDITPAVGVKALDKILELRDSNKNHARSRRKNDADGASVVITELCNLITSSGSSEVILDGLRTVVRHRHNEAERKLYVDTFIEVIFSRICDGTISLPEILEVTLLLVNCGTQYLDTVDHFWQSIVTQTVDMEKDDIVKLYGLLPYFKSSQSVVLRAVARNTTKKILSLNSEDVAYILNVLTRLKLVPQSLLSSLTKWVNLNLHVIPEKDFGSVMRCLNDLRYLDASISRAVERYVRIRGSSCDEHTIDALSAYCHQFRWRSDAVLSSASDFFVANHKSVSLPTAVNVVRAFGYLNLTPKNPMGFFGSLEWLLREKFNVFRPDHLVEILVACVYLQRYPLNFVKKVFSPYFLDRMTDTLEESILRKTHQKLKFLDSALTLECKQYYGPFLPRDYSAKSVKRDGRLLRLMCSLQEDMEQVLGVENFSFSVVQPRLPLLDMYIIDYVVQLNKQGKPVTSNAVAGVDKKLAVIIALPEHYCMDGSHPMGAHATRIRLLENLGYSVVELSFDTLQKLRPASKDRIRYLSAKILPAQPN